MDPPNETARALSDLYTLQCSQWVPIRNSQIRKYQHIEKTCRHQRQMDPPGWNCQSSEWPLHFSMQSMSPHSKQSNNRKISGNTTAEKTCRYQRQMVPPHLKLLDKKVTATRFHSGQWVPIRNSQIIGRYQEIPVYIRIQMPKADGPPHLKLLEEKVTAKRLHTINENPFETVNLLENIRKYQYI